LDEEKFGSANWFKPGIFTQFAEAGKRHSKVTPATEECNNYDPTAAPCF
jgi:hypothetical protein